ncbi:hypothetical protein COJ85_30860 [Bacillus sp. AFS076308]|uniref:hypothetical protein n=1 Tax=unclassified Bacillus (in: firmicutes) TaxID=185979 RepID=UPI000BFA6A25|nr:MULTISPECIES: hypothetical protein [unclassified Bacillus (in: firmicutes)]PFN79144.1 hypothetical protein COJ85_30860 [Bacillus sp. AFS076308]PGV49591.1 hypothetical protein COD92_21655 [Bacillus sp. AFS037270]
MKWGTILGCTALIIVIILFQSSRLKKKQVKEKAALLTLSILGWMLAILMLFFPDMPGPTQFIDWIYRPLGELLK